MIKPHLKLLKKLVEQNPSPIIAEELYMDKDLIIKFTHLIDEDSRCNVTFYAQETSTRCEIYHSKYDERRIPWIHTRAGITILTFEAAQAVLCSNFLRSIPNTEYIKGKLLWYDWIHVLDNNTKKLHKYLNIVTTGSVSQYKNNNPVEVTSLQKPALIG